ncbi:MAG: hypothetical protein R3F11_11415 [Verrucomicrobiales bacterium]
MAMGYEDLNDHDTLRRDPMMALGVSQARPARLGRSGRDGGGALASKSTLNPAGADQLQIRRQEASSCCRIRQVTR